MDMNEYLAVWILRERLAEARASAGRRAGVGSLHSPGWRVRLHLGHALIRLGQWILGPAREYAGEPLGLLSPGATGKPMGCCGPALPPNTS